MKHFKDYFYKIKLLLMKISIIIHVRHNFKKFNLDLRMKTINYLNLKQKALIQILLMETLMVIYQN